jgi:hypothetical protein
VSTQQRSIDHDADHPERDQRWDADTRNETPAERLDRNWGELLQELRVVQTGVQLLTGFLLTLPFQQRFTELTDVQRRVYLVTVALAAGSTSLLIAPVALHRVLFRQHARRTLVSIAHRCALAGSMLLGLAVSAVSLLIFDVVAGDGAGFVAGGLTLLAITLLWGVMPLMARAHAERDEDRR